jgi:hypothetical protein
MKLSAAALSLVALTTAHAERDISLYTGIDIGRFENGYDFFEKYDIEGTALNRTYVDVTVADRLNEAFTMTVGVGGIFWKAFEPEVGEPEAKVIKFGPGISQAYMKWKPSESWDLSFGYFRYKYNPSARNLGEYLFRTEAYPTIIFTGGWEWINGAHVRTPGLKFSHATETFQQDVCLFGEYFNSPIFDFTPAYLATWKPSSAFSLGGGISLHRFLSPNAKIRKELTRTYYYYDNFTLPAGQPGTADSARLISKMPRLVADIRNTAGNDGKSFEEYKALPENVGLDSQSVSFDNRAIKVMAFANLNFNGLLGWDAKEVGAFELYGEIAQLGFKNYPIFYTKYTERMPIMLGLSLPTFGILDQLAFEFEYLKNPNVESLASTFDVLDLPPEINFRYKVFNKDDTKWTVFASRQLTSALSLVVQVANDHMRLKDKYARPEFVPGTNDSKHWYWLTRIQWSI